MRADRDRIVPHTLQPVQRVAEHLASRRIASKQTLHEEKALPVNAS